MLWYLCLAWLHLPSLVRGIWRCFSHLSGWACWRYSSSNMPCNMPWLPLLQCRTQLLDACIPCSKTTMGKNGKRARWIYMKLLCYEILQVWASNGKHVSIHFECLSNSIDYRWQKRMRSATDVTSQWAVAFWVSDHFTHRSVSVTKGATASGGSVGRGAAPTRWNLHLSWLWATINETKNRTELYAPEIRPEMTILNSPIIILFNSTW